MAPKRQLDFHWQLPVQMAKPETHLVVELTAMWQPPPEKLWENSPPMAILPVAAD